MGIMTEKEIKKEIKLSNPVIAGLYSGGTYHVSSCSTAYKKLLVHEDEDEDEE